MEHTNEHTLIKAIKKYRDKYKSGEIELIEFERILRKLKRSRRRR